MLKIINGKIPITLRGINLGSWLMLEGYILGGRNLPEHIFKTELAKKFGKSFLKEFSRRFRETFIQEKDLIRIKKLGFNCVRLPFNYRILEEENGLSYLKKTIKAFARHKIYVILDMHALPGSQNPDWHADSSGRALFWTRKAYQKKYLTLWKKLAQTFKDEVWIAGYDVMNEPVTSKVPLLQSIYRQVIEVIRKTGDRHIIFLEGNQWAMEVDFINDLKGDNLALSIHYYQPAHFTFNWLPGSRYPGKVLGKIWNKPAIKKILKKYALFSQKAKLPVLAGEFGVASRCSSCGREFVWLKDVLSIFEEFGFHWTYWTYKAVKGLHLPDGLFQLNDPSGIIGNLCGPSGMDNFYQVLKDRKAEFFKIWDTGNFEINPSAYRELKKYLV